MNRMLQSCQFSLHRCGITSIRVVTIRETLISRTLTICGGIIKYIMKRFLVTFVLSDNGKFHHDDQVGLDMIAEDMDELALNLHNDVDLPDGLVSDRIMKTVEENIPGLPFDTYTPIQIGEFNEEGKAMLVWEDAEYRFDNESTH